MHWVIRSYQPGDEQALVRLFERVFQRPVTTDHWLWKLKGTRSPVENVWLAVHDDQPIFQYAGIPLRFLVDGSSVTGMVSVDTMTAPEFQRRGLLTEVGTHTYKKWREAGIPFVLGLPNERWGSRTNALGWVEVCDFQWLARPLRIEPPAARRTGLKPLERMTAASALWNAFWDARLGDAKGIQIKHVTSAGQEFDRLWEQTRLDAFISVQHDRAWVQWRYLDVPTLNYTVLLAQREDEPVGFAAWRTSQDGNRRAGLVAHVESRRDAPEAASALWREILARMRNEGVETVLTLAIPDSRAWKWLRRIGFVPRHSFSLQVVPLNPALSLERWKEPASWNLAGGDFDVI